MNIHDLFDCANNEFANNGVKDTLAIPKSVKKSSAFTKLRSQNSKIRFSVIHDVI